MTSHASPVPDGEGVDAGAGLAFGAGRLGPDAGAGDVVPLLTKVPRHRPFREPLKGGSTHTQEASLALLNSTR